jgi:hypothetical protein
MLQTGNFAYHWHPFYSLITNLARKVAGPSRKPLTTVFPQEILAKMGR